MPSNLTYRVKWRSGLDGRWEHARYDAAPNKGRVIHFPKRQKARQWIRNHEYMVDGPSAWITGGIDDEEIKIR